MKLYLHSHFRSLLSAISDSNRHPLVIGAVVKHVTQLLLLRSPCPPYPSAGYHLCSGSCSVRVALSCASFKSCCWSREAEMELFPYLPCSAAPKSTSCFFIVTSSSFHCSDRVSIVAVAPSVVQCSVLKCKRKPGKWKASLQGLLFFFCERFSFMLQHVYADSSFCGCETCRDFCEELH